MTTQPSNWCNTGHQPCPTPHLCNGGSCYFDTAELPIQMLPDPPEWQNTPPEFHWTIFAWALLLVVGAFLLVGLVL